MSHHQLQIFRETIRRLDPTRPIQTPEQHAWYVERPEEFATSLARTLQLDPTGSHLVVGPIGCGKSTELLAAGRTLLQSPGIYPRYVEVSRVQDLDVADSEAIAVAVADDLANQLWKGSGHDAELDNVRAQLKPLVEGGYDPHWEVGFGDDPGNFNAVVTRPRSKVPEAIEHILPILTSLKQIVSQRHGFLIWLLDGLDRLSDPVQFDTLMEPFLRALEAVGIGVAVTGPRRSISGLSRVGVADAFDEIHLIGPVDPTSGPGLVFLERVLKARRLEEVIPLRHQPELIRWSGGAMRLLLQITKECVKEAWLKHVNVVGREQVSAAADKVGRGLLLGLSDPEITLLGSVLKGNVFALRSAEDVALLITNRVLEYQTEGGVPRYEVHPTLVPFLERLAVTLF